MDKEGRPTTDPFEANVGVLMPFGAHKGYAMELIGSLLSFALSGADMDDKIPRPFECRDQFTNIGQFMGCIDISRFCPVEDFKARVDGMFAVLKACRPAAGSTGVMIPGEIEVRKTEEALRDGIDLSEAVLGEFREMSQTFGVPCPF